MDGGKKYKTFLGTYREVKKEAFFIKFLLLGIITTVFLSRNMPLMLGTLAAVLILSIFLLGRDTLKVFKFLMLSTVVLTIVWIFFVGRIWSSGNFLETIWQTLQSFEYRNALLRLYGMFLTGQLFLGMASQYELLASLRRIDASASIFVMLVLMFNSVSYFICSYSDIRTGYSMRCRKKGTFRRTYYVFIALALEAMELISDCKKVYYLDAERIRNSLKKKLPEKEKEVSHGSHVLSISLENILYYDMKEPVLRKVSGTFETGQIYVIHGANGVGKSTFLNTVSGVIPEIIRAEGEIQVCLDQNSVYGHIGYVPQGVEKSLFFDTPASMLDHLPREKTKPWITRFGLERIDLECRTVGELSSGECKKFELIGEILNDTHEILLLDEPSAYLDDNAKKTLMELIESVKAKKIIFLVTHDSFFDKIDAQFYCLEKDGLHTWKPEDKLTESQEGKKVYRKTSGWHCRVEIPDMLKENLGYTFSNLEFSEGRTLAVLGENGTGKTVLNTWIFRHFREQLPEKVCLMMRQEMNKQFFAMTVEEEMLLGTNKKCENREKAQKLLEKAGLLEYSQFPPYFLSGGQKRILLILCMLMQTPDLMILDEPFDSMDVKHRKILLEILEEYQEQSGVCYLFSDQTDEYFAGFADEKYFLERK